jgi:hypothetical protein
MTFRANFLIECVTSLTWMLMNLGFYLLIFNYTKTLGPNTGWGRDEFFAFLATTMLVNSLVQTFFMPNCEEVSELIRTGGLDFALLKPIDTQFCLLVMEWSASPTLPAGLASSARAVDDADADSPGCAESSSLCLYALRMAILYADDRPFGDEHLAGPKPLALRLLVLHHQLLALPDGNLQRSLGLAAAMGLHVYYPGARRGECSRADHRSARLAVWRNGLAPGPVHTPRHRRQPACQPLGVSGRAAQLPQRLVMTLA